MRQHICSNTPFVVARLTLHIEVHQNSSQVGMKVITVPPLPCMKIESYKLNYMSRRLQKQTLWL